MREYPCGHSDAAGADPDVLARLGLSFPDIHTRAASMASLARGIKDKSGSALCLVPFCCTVEAEAFGASIRLGDVAVGPRAGAFVCSSLRDVLHLPPLNLTAGRIAQVLEACAALARAGEAVALEISGPLTILNALLDLTTVFKEWRKDETLFCAVLSRLRQDLGRYARAARERGVAAISYADPAGAVSVLGPRRYAVLAKQFIAPFLKELSGEPAPAVMVHVCPKTAQALVGTEHAAWRELPAPGGASYPEACLAACGEGRLFGETCLKNAGYRLKNGRLKILAIP